VPPDCSYILASLPALFSGVVKKYSSVYLAVVMTDLMAHMGM